jgi:hypothetical protein
MITCARLVLRTMDIDFFVFIGLAFSGFRFIAARAAKKRGVPFDEKFNKTLFVSAILLFCVALAISLVSLFGPLC